MEYPINKTCSGEAFSVAPCDEVTREQILSRYTRGPGMFVCADSITLLVDGGQTLRQMLEAIDQAAATVDLETYILAADHTGQEFLEAMCRAIGRGVSVRLLYDYAGSMWLPNSFVNKLADVGVDVRVFHPLAIARPTWAFNRRDHRKLLVVDEKTTFTGGLNISDDYAALTGGGRGWRDTHVRIEGQDAARAAMGSFEYAWQKAIPWRQTRNKGTMLKAGIQRLRHPVSMRKLFSRQTMHPVCPPDSIAVQLLGNREFKLRKRIQNAYLHAINHANHYIFIENAYFIPAFEIRLALSKAVRRGVQVAVVLARDSDAPLAAYASRHLYMGLLKAGIRIFEWPTTMMHAKTAVIDDAWAIVGSYNFDHRSLFHNLESAVLVADPAFAKKLCERMAADIAQCTEITFDRHQQRKPHHKLLETMAYFFRTWL
ncbi:MAG: phosphatidylserine/phosphatidylglycerophosphate/cardiolipin synthase family protein [Sedimentisphaerales bacterium]|nr:phosphatidylserine/phosphatidylglycerophosphate/cardiolipin synthase family protein [Sedimentisphaerales bacterium]